MHARVEIMEVPPIDVYWSTHFTRLRHSGVCPNASTRGSRNLSTYRKNTPADVFAGWRALWTLLQEADSTI